MNTALIDLPVGQQQQPGGNVFICLDLALPFCHSTPLGLALTPAWHTPRLTPSSPALSDAGSDPGTNTPLKNAPDTLQGYLAINPLKLRGIRV